LKDTKVKEKSSFVSIYIVNSCLIQIQSENCEGLQWKARKGISWFYACGLVTKSPTALRFGKRTRPNNAYNCEISYMPDYKPLTNFNRLFISANAILFAYLHHQNKNIIP
jgi:hypothetical protein